MSALVGRAPYRTAGRRACGGGRWPRGRPTVPTARRQVALRLLVSSHMAHGMAFLHDGLHDGQPQDMQLDGSKPVLAQSCLAQVATSCRGVWASRTRLSRTWTRGGCASGSRTLSCRSTTWKARRGQMGQSLHMHAMALASLNACNHVVSCKRSLLQHGPMHCDASAHGPRMHLRHMCIVGTQAVVKPSTASYMHVQCPPPDWLQAFSSTTQACPLETWATHTSVSAAPCLLFVAAGVSSRSHMGRALASVWLPPDASRLSLGLLLHCTVAGLCAGWWNACQNSAPTPACGRSCYPRYLPQLWRTRGGHAT